jgi:hypothetical protein
LKGRGTRILRVKPGERKTPENFWFLVDLFRKNPISGWSGQRVDFFRTDGFWGGGIYWTLEAHVSLDFSGEIEARVILLDQDSDRGTGWLWRCENEVIAFMKRVQVKMKKLGYQGGFRPDPISGGFCAHFFRQLVDAKDAWGERETLSSLDLGEGAKNGKA